ncbi:MAG: hypothetical protein QXU32_09410 [Nitrososphaerales archaeon]
MQSLRLFLSLLLVPVFIVSIGYQQVSADHNDDHTLTTTKQKFSLAVLSYPNILYIDGSGIYDEGRVVTTGKAPLEWKGYKFVGWQVNGQWYADNPVTLRMDRNHKAVANYVYEGDIRKITIDTLPRIANVVVDGKLYLPTELPLKFEWSLNSKHTISIDDSVKENTGTRYVFDTWNDLNREKSRTLIVDNDIDLKAVFKVQHYLKLISEYGRVQGSGWYNEGSIVEFSVSPTEVIDENNAGIRYVFNGWDDGDYRNSATNTIAIEKPLTIRASWKQQYKLELVSSIPALDVRGSGWYDRGEKVALIAEKEFNANSIDTKYVFGRWVSQGYNPVVIDNAYSNYASLTMNDPYTIGAEWNKAYYVNVITPYGTARGSGYYTEGTYADISIATKEVEIDKNRVRVVFAGWDVKGSELSTSSGIADGFKLLHADDLSGLELIKPETGSGSNSGAGSNSAVTDQTAQNLKIRVMGPTVVTAKWQDQYYLSLSTSQGKVSGAGWYDNGQVAKIGVESPASPPGLWSRYMFDGWSGDHVGDSASANVIMNKPKNVTAEWREDYTPGVMNSMIVGGVGAASAVMYRRSKKNGNVNGHGNGNHNRYTNGAI